MKEFVSRTKDRPLVHFAILLPGWKEISSLNRLFLGNRLLAACAKPKSKMAEDYASSLCRASGAQLVKNSGFSHASSSAIDTVSDVIAKYVSHVCATAQGGSRVSLSLSLSLSLFPFPSRHRSLTLTPRS